MKWSNSNLLLFSIISMNLFRLTHFGAIAQDEPNQKRSIYKCFILFQKRLLEQLLLRVLHIIFTKIDKVHLIRTTKKKNNFHGKKFQCKYVMFVDSNWRFVRKKVIPDKKSQTEGFLYPDYGLHSNEEIIKIGNRTRQRNVYFFVVICELLCVVRGFVYFASCLHIVE